VGWTISYAEALVYYAHYVTRLELGGCLQHFIRYSSDPGALNGDSVYIASRTPFSVTPGMAIWSAYCADSKSSSSACCGAGKKGSRNSSVFSLGSAALRSVPGCCIVGVTLGGWFSLDPGRILSREHYLFTELHVLPLRQMVRLPFVRHD
jgi:hypothetical protein